MAAVASASQAGEMIAGSINLCLGYAERLIRDIPAEKFAHMPHAKMNHPAFILGHLSLYPDRAFKFLSMPQRMAARPGYDELFNAGVDCVEQDGRYPQKDDLVAHYFERFRAVAAVLPTVSDETLQGRNPGEGRIAQMFPVLGGALNFMLATHHGIHLGQLSAWRRAAGLGPA